MKQRGQPASFTAVQQIPFVQGNAQTSPAITSKTFGQLARIRYGIFLLCLPSELNAKSRGERPLRNERRTIRVDKGTPALFEILRVKRAAVKPGEIKIGTKQPR